MRIFWIAHIYGLTQSYIWKMIEWAWAKHSTNTNLNISILQQIVQIGLPPTLKKKNNKDTIRLNMTAFYITYTLLFLKFLEMGEHGK